MKNAFLGLLLLCCFATQAQKFENLALTPPMGWNSWNTFQANINEKIVMGTADMMVSSGMKAAGYNCLVLDDGWMAMERNANGDLVPDPKKFPNGMKNVANYVHAKGLKFGLYNCAGKKTCAGYPGTRGHEYQDARFYASMGVDYLKFDWCSSDGINAKEAYTTMSDALRETLWPVIFSLCEWGSNKPWEWATNVGHLWRTTSDITNQFDGKKNIGTWSAFGVMTIVDLQVGLEKYAGPGHWNDPDMLEVGNGMTLNEDRAHFSMWCMLAAPLIAGNDIRKMTKETAAILMNKNAIAINQDAAGIQGFRYSNKDSLQTWFKPLKSGEWAVCFLNRGATAQNIVFDWKKNMVTDSVSKQVLNAATAEYKIRNVWTDKMAGTTSTTLKATVPGHDVLMLRLSK